MIERDIDRRISEANSLLERARKEIFKIIVGQTELVDRLLMGVITGGHILVEGVPGLAKTLAVKTAAEVLSVDFKRIQFTPDLLPADLIGNMIYRKDAGDFVARKGPVFTNIVLADEINRAPAKVQSALLEAMAENQVTLGDRSYALPSPFFVLATQNPIEQEGTYQLPEAQLDRFIMKVLVDYPTPDEEFRILQRMGQPQKNTVEKVLGPVSISELRSLAYMINIDEEIQKYIVAIVGETRIKDKKHGGVGRYLEYGASPRATLSLLSCARVKALYEGRSFVLPEDIKDVAYDVLRHRLILSYEAEAEDLTPDSIIEEVLRLVPVP